MLSPAQVVPFLTHDDRLVRRLARDYFDRCGDPGPATADDVWAALDRFPAGDEARSLARTLADLPQTDASVHRLVAALAGDAVHGADDLLQQAARGVDFPLLVRHREQLLGCDGLDPKVRDHLARRLGTADTPGGVAWDQLMALGLASVGQNSSEVDRDGADVLIEAAARRIEVTGPLAVALLGDAAVQDWREIFAVRVVGEARYGPAVPLLVAKLGIDADVLLEESAAAVGRIGSDDAIDRLAVFDADGGEDDAWGLNLYVGDALGRIKRPASEAALLARIGREPDDEIKVRLHNDLLDLCSLAGLDAARLLVAADPRHPESVGLCERLVAAAVMHGVTLPEDARWRDRVRVHDAEVAARRAKLEAGGLAAFAERMRQRSPDFADPPTAEELPPIPPLDIGGYDPYARFEPIRGQPKVGRNDPCPCGSGKKYKKCHGVGGG